MIHESSKTRLILSFSMAIALFEGVKAFDFFPPGADLSFSGRMILYLALTVAIVGALIAYMAGRRIGRRALVCALGVAFLVEFFEALSSYGTSAEGAVFPIWFSVISPYLLPIAAAYSIWLLLTDDKPA